LTFNRGITFTENLFGQSGLLNFESIYFIAMKCNTSDLENHIYEFIYVRIHHSQNSTNNGGQSKYHLSFVNDKTPFIYRSCWRRPEYDFHGQIKISNSMFDQQKESSRLSAEADVFAAPIFVARHAVPIS